MGKSCRIRSALLAEQDFATCCDLSAGSSTNEAGLLQPMARPVRLATKVLSGRKELQWKSPVTQSQGTSSKPETNNWNNADEGTIT